MPDFSTTSPSLHPPASSPNAALHFVRGLLPFAIALLASFMLHRFVAPALGDSRSKLMIDAGINIILAVSLNIVNGYTGEFSLGHAGFMMIGGYVSGIITYYGSIKLWGGFYPVGEILTAQGALFLVACVVGGLAASFAGLLVSIPCLRLRGDYLAIVTLGFGEILRVFVQQSKDIIGVVSSSDLTRIKEAPWTDLVTRVGGALGFGGLPFHTNIFWSYIFVFLTLIIAYRLKHSSYGRAFLAIREDERAAEALGVPVFKYKVRAFVISAFFAGVAGALFAHEIGTTLNPRELGFMKSFEIVIMVVLGGMGSMSGAVLAAIMLTILPEVLRAFAEWRMIIYALALVLMMILRPQGICGIREIWEFIPLRRLLRRKVPSS
jgi:branched-chain amino acid transport system permease protein